MVELSIFPDHNVSGRLSEMRKLLYSLPEDIDQRILFDAIQKKGSVEFSKESNLAWSSIDVSGQFMIALDRTLEQAQVPWALGRVSLEASSRAAWLLDVSLTPSQRLERCYALLLDDLPGLKFRTQDQREKIRIDREKYLEEAQKRGVSLSEEEFRNLVPGKQAMAEQELGMGLWYSELSQRIHPNHAAIQVDAAMALANHDAKGTVLIPVVIWAYGVAVWRFFQTRDLPSDRLEDTLGDAGRIMGFPPQFWKKRPRPQRPS